MGSQELMKQLEETISALYFINLDEIRDAIREELVAEVRDEVRQELADEIREELEFAVEAANKDDAPEIGTDGDWGKDDAAGLSSFLETFNTTW
jgi:thermostable 8-oxoguanine DNA glycosylase